MKPSCRMANRSGFTLVESVLAVMILGIALGACILSFSMAMRAVNTAGNQMAAVHSCRNALEALRTNSFSSTALQLGAGTFSNATISCTYTVTTVDANTKNISVSMPYRNYIHGGFSTNTLTTSLVSTLHP
ncbi:MAG: type II secretion system protein [Verrucomicrobiia bacterium]|jgi:prepilin-type N-terminal cleavage/methylation domain-containing protein